MRKRRGPRPERTEEEIRRHEEARIEARTLEEWIDEGTVGPSSSSEYGRRTGDIGIDSGSIPRPQGEIDPAIIATIYEQVGPERGARLVQRLRDASDALDGDRLSDARRLIVPLLREIPSVVAVQEIAGLVAYGQRRWGEAAAHLELAQRIEPDAALLPVLADVYRAQQRWDDVAQLWTTIKAHEVNPEIVAEGRIVAACSLADQGRIEPAIRMMNAASGQPQKIKDYHLRQWYVLGDLHDRAGDPLSATGWFRLVWGQDPNFADVAQRLEELGR